MLIRAVLIGAALLLAGAPAALADLTRVGGVVVLPQDRRLPDGSFLLVRVLDITRGLKRAVILSEQRLRIDGERTPFRLIYDRRFLRSDGRFIVRAALNHRGKWIYVVNEPLPIGDGDRANRMRLILANPGQQAGPRSLYGKKFRAIEARDRPIPGHIGVTLEFTREGTVRGSTGCNSLRGPYDATAQTLRFGELAVTRRGCTPDRGRVEKRMLRVLSQTRAWQVEGPRLTLRDDAGEVIAVLRDDL